MRNHLLSVALLALCQPALALTLAEKSATDFTIVTPRDASLTTQTAAKELQKYLEEVTGAKFPISDESEKSEKKAKIHVGVSQDTRRLLPDVRWNRLKSDDILIKTKGTDLILAGGDPRGTLYAVYHFLEEVVGCEWWTSKDSTIPSKPELIIPDLNIAYSPQFIYRDAYFSDISNNPEFAAKLKRNGQADDKGLPATLGGNLSFIGWVHTFDRFMPSSVYAAKHPEWGAEVNGKRIGWEQLKGQICLTNEEAKAKMLEIVLTRLAKADNPKIISLSQNDNNNRCQCARCLEVEKEEGSPSGPLIRYVNDIAREVKKSHPDVLVETLAYFYSVKAPLKVKPDDNVLIRLCSYTEDHSMAFSDKRNPKFRRDLGDWKAISKQIFVWDYTPDFNDALKLRPNLFRQRENLQLFAQNDVIGVFSQGPTKAQVTDFMGMRAWLIQHLLWNPKADANALIQRYLNGYYGAAGKDLYQYLRLMDAAANKADVTMSGNGASHMPFSAETLNKARELFDQAQKSVIQDPVLLRRVKIERIALDYMVLLRYPELRQGGTATVLFQSDDEAIKACDQLVIDAEDAGIDINVKSNGWGSIKEAAEVLKIRCLPMGPLPELTGKDRVVVFPGFRMDLWGYGTRTFLVPDKTASQNSAAKLVHTANAPFVSLDLPRSMEGKNWKVYAVVRHEGKSEGKITLGVNQHQSAKPILRKELSLRQGQKYHTIEVGTGSFKTLDYFFLAAADGAEGNEGSTFLDRAYFIESKPEASSR